MWRETQSSWQLCSSSSYNRLCYYRDLSHTLNWLHNLVLCSECIIYVELAIEPVDLVCRI